MTTRTANASKPKVRPKLSKAERDERAAKALRMRNAGATFAKIGQQLGVTEQQAKNDVGRAVREWVKIPCEQMVDRQRAILLDILRVEYPAAMDPTSDRHYQAQDKILEVLTHEAKLFGLNAPQKVNLGISELEFARHAAELLQVTGVRPLLELAAPVLEAEVVAEAPADLSVGAGGGDRVLEAQNGAEDVWSNL